MIHLYRFASTFYENSLELNLQLSLHSDCACRVLMFLAVADAKKSSIQEIAQTFDISENHLIKVVHKLGKFGFLNTTRGRAGGTTLGRSPSEISIGDVIRKMEPNFTIVECFDLSANKCPLAFVCHLKSALATARDAFFGSLDAVTLEDITKNRKQLTRSLGILQQHQV